MAVEKVYKGVPAGEVPKLDDAYLATARAVSTEQIKRAGVRLAMVLNGSLGDAPP